MPVLPRFNTPHRPPGPALPLTPFFWKRHSRVFCFNLVEMARSLHSTRSGRSAAGPKPSILTSKERSGQRWIWPVQAAREMGDVFSSRSTGEDHMPVGPYVPNSVRSTYLISFLSKYRIAHWEVLASFRMVSFP